MATLDATTQAEYAAEANAADRAQVIIDALTAPVYARVYNTDNSIMGEGVMSSPWATVSEDKLIPATVDGFFVSAVDTWDDGWYCQFESGSRYVRFSFGLSDSGKEAVWSLPTWDVGARAGISSSVINVIGNRSPVWSGAPSTLSFTQGAGGTSNFSAYVSDPDDDTLTYSLVGTAYAGISIGATTGILTVTSAAGSAVRNLTIRATDSNGLYADHSCGVTISDAAAFKWYPGQYPYADTNLFPSKDSGQASFRSSLIAADTNKYITGTRFIIPWGLVEPGQKGAYNWAQVDYWINQYATLGYKVILGFWWQSFGNYTSAGTPPSTPQTGEHFIPDYIVQGGWWYQSANTRAVKMWLQQPMDHYIDFLAAVAARYDNDERIAMVSSEEGTWALPLDGSASNTTVRDGTLAQCQRLITAARGMFRRTPYFLYNNFLGGQARAGEAVDRQLELGIGIATPDLKPGPPDTLGPVEYNMRYLRGERWNGTTWIAGVGPDQRMSGLVLAEKQVNRNMSWTPATCYAWAKDIAKGHFLPWSCQNPAYFYSQTGNPDYRIPAMDRANILAYLAAAPRPMRTDMPSTVGGGQAEVVVVTGSSTVSLWSTIQTDFAPQTVIKKGVSGTTAADLQANLSTLVLQYSPTKVGIYQGDNDIAGGVTPAAFVATYRQVLQAINAQFPSCQCYAISIKPSPARMAYWETMQTANALLASMCNEDSRWHYINASDALLSAGVPVTAYYDPSGSPPYLHLSSAGYAVWAPIVVDGMGF